LRSFTGLNQLSELRAQWVRSFFQIVVGFFEVLVVVVLLLTVRIGDGGLSFLYEARSVCLLFFEDALVSVSML